MALVMRLAPATDRKRKFALGIAASYHVARRARRLRQQGERQKNKSVVKTYFTSFIKYT